MNKKQLIRINENQLKQIVMESVERVLNEGNNGFIDTLKGAWAGAKAGEQKMSQARAINNQQLADASKIYKNVQEAWLWLKNVQGNDDSLINAKRYLEKAYRAIQFRNVKA